MPTLNLTVYDSSTNRPIPDVMAKVAYKVVTHVETETFDEREREIVTTEQILEPGMGSGETDQQGKVSLAMPTAGAQYLITLDHPSYRHVEWLTTAPQTEAYFSTTMVPSGVAVTPTCSLRITATAGGTTAPYPGTYAPSPGTPINVYALPDPGFKVARWEVNGVPQPPTDVYSFVIQADTWVNCVFEAEAPPVLPPPTPTLGVLEGFVTDKEKATPISAAKVWLGDKEAITTASGAYMIPDLNPGTFTAMCSAANYDTLSAEVTIRAGEATTQHFALTAFRALDPWGALTNMLSGIWDMFIGAMQGLGKTLAGPISAQSDKILVQTLEGMSAGSPDPEIAKKATELAEALRKRQEEIIRAIYKRSPALEQTPGAATTIAAGFLATQVGVMVASQLVDLLHPIKNMGVRQVASDILATVGTGGVVSQIVNMPTTTGLIPQLYYWYNSQFTPLIPNLPDLITMLVREVLTPDEYVGYAAQHGESKTWADRRWEAHWRLPAPDMVIDAYHRGIITADERDKYLVWHDYKPTPRPGVTPTDLRIIAGLQKTLIPRVDVRRAYAYGIWSKDQVAKAYIGLGYEEDAGTMADIQIEAAVEALKNRVRTTAEGLLRDRLKDVRGDLAKYEKNLEEQVAAGALTEAQAAEAWRAAMGLAQERRAAVTADFRKVLEQVKPMQDMTELRILNADLASQSKYVAAEFTLPTTIAEETP